MIPELFLICALWGAFCAVVANIRARRPVTLGLLFVIVGFASAELARFFLAFQVLATIVWVAVGALAEPEGWLGLAITMFSVAGLERPGLNFPRYSDLLREAYAGARGGDQ